MTEAFLPWHPAVVHLPIGLGLVLPFIGAALLICERRKLLPTRAWAMVVLLQWLVFSGGVAAIKTGENETRRVVYLVGSDAIAQHEDQAKIFLGVAGASLILGAGGLWQHASPAGFYIRVVSVLASSAAAALSGITGHSGGQIVYEKLISPTHRK